MRTSNRNELQSLVVTAPNHVAQSVAPPPIGHLCRNDSADAAALVVPPSFWENEIDNPLLHLTPII
jgi:hypothetical protein